ncbi:hypothetical protein O6H91_04G043900 [Diphasiastrum complanatum]|nr:hypothetical protein O6H91_04G043900 [Diphasiastrum complanatum]
MIPRNFWAVRIMQSRKLTFGLRCMLLFSSVHMIHCFSFEVKMYLT